MIVVVIPAYEPNQSLVTLVDQIQSPIVIVNDGSSAVCAPIFDALRQKPNVQVISHAVNMGKGEALRTGFNRAMLDYPEAKGVVTADADGQHLPKDILKLSEALEADTTRMHLGVREFDQNVPLRSQFGNQVTKWIFRLLIGVKLTDTQTGLRGIPTHFLPELMHIKSRGYEFELDMLILAHKHQLNFHQITIDTVYENNNQSSHFNPVIDSLKIYYVFFRFLLFAIVSGLLDYLAFTLMYFFIGHIFFAEAFARIFSGTCNFLFNKELVFRSKNAVTVEALKYTLLCTVNLGLSYAMISSMVYLGASVHLSKLAALFVLFFANFAIQQLFIFTSPQTEPPAQTVKS